MNQNADIIAEGPGYRVRRGEVTIQAVRSSGPGGQNVNKVATKVVLHFDVANAAGLSEYVRSRMAMLFQSQMTVHGVLVLSSDRHRSQHQNRQDVLAKLAGKLRQAATRPRKRRRTTIPRSVNEKRLRSKHKRAAVKSLRGRVGRDED